jgi:hypothetical protein
VKVVFTVLSALLVGFLVFKGFSVFWTKRRSGAHSNWKNEAFAAREESGSWVENDCAVGRDDSASPSVFPGIK